MRPLFAVFSEEKAHVYDNRISRSLSSTAATNRRRASLKHGVNLVWPLAADAAFGVSKLLVQIRYCRVT
jgi:hypothetical protein